MIKIYTSSSCASSRKAIRWLKNHNLEFEEINWYKKGMPYQDYLKILSLTENGTDEIISKKSLAYRDFSKYMECLSLKEVYICLHTQKTLLRLPLVLDPNHLQVGYNTDDIRQFIPHGARKIKMIV